tara:strand:- start:862 stop:1392 length:531 start_codon:yes stop_codon:yes gene_type:complete
MDDLDIDGSLPGQELEEEEDTDEIRREGVSQSSSSNSETWDDSTMDEDSQRGMLYLVAGVGYGALVVYLVLVIYQGMKIPILSPDTNIDNTNGALSTSILISAMVFITIWVFMSGKNHSFFTEDPDKAKFWAGIIGLVSLVIIATSWEAYQTVMTVSALLTSVSTWAYLRSSQMKV